MTLSLQRPGRFAPVFALVALLAGCASAPPREVPTGPSHETVGAPDVVQSTPPATPPQATVPVSPVPPPPIATPVQPPPPAVAATPQASPDLFDRIRAGFQLSDVDARAVDVQTNWYANNPEYLERVLGRSELYLHHIVTEIEARGMPMELALLPVVESAFEPYAYSRSRAAGLWQFIPGTGSRFGLKQDWWYDGRRDVVESTRAALDYLQYLHDEFNGDWLLAVAGYNCGEACVGRAVRANRAAGRPISFWSLKLPTETRAYVPKLLAMRRLVANPEDYGIEFSPIPNERYFARVETGGQIDMKLAAELAGITYEELYELNPAFHRWATDPTGPHYLLVPADVADLFRETAAQLSPDERMRVSRYRVQSGDTLASVARRFDTQSHVIRELNQLGSNDPLRVGSELRVPSGATALPQKVALAAARVDRRGTSGTRTTRRPVIHVVRSGDSLWGIARRHRMDVNTLASLNGMHPGDTLRAGQRLKLASGGASKKSSRSGGSSQRKVTYTVRSGDTLSRIARLFQVSVSQIASWNGLGSSSTLRPGQRLVIRVRRN